MNVVSDSIRNWRLAAETSQRWYPAFAIEIDIFVLLATGLCNRSTT